MSPQSPLARLAQFSARPLAQPLSYLRGQTIDFDSPNTEQNPYAGPGYTLEVRGHGGSLRPETAVRTSGTVTGLDIGRTTHIRFGAVMGHVKVRLVHRGHPANVAVLNFAGHVLLGKSMTVGPRYPRTSSSITPAFIRWRSSHSKRTC